ncbi:mannosyl-glycoprotein endo-beta-N-acetylglucosamidase [Scheffersomyces amazonensis]|uniref:mannosyl-glycoprotein endo-beta-N-acetylglucosamidase n=1 Tax=Scheffersomyces amazonensis TaxID=1078765 RepID=UPI00315C7F96
MKLLLFLISLFHIVQVSVGAKVNPLPAPRNTTWLDSNSIEINVPALTLRLNRPNDVLEDAFIRIKGSIESVKWYPAATEGPMSSMQPFPTATNLKKRLLRRQIGGISTVDVNVDDFNADLQLGVNETYTIDVSSSGITINAATVWAALDAFTTFQQLIIYENNQFSIEGSVSIWDSPLFGHRGLLIDTGRNFISLAKIYEQVDLMSLSKLNALHIHFEDTASWPLFIEAFPEMTNDAYSPREIYQPGDLVNLIIYAKNRGVRIIPEIDAPAHARAGWQQIDPSLIACGNSWWSNDVYTFATGNEPPPGQLDILYNKTYDVLDTIYQELGTIFTDNFYHIGGDEINGNCYNFSSRIQEWFAENSTRTYNDLTQYYLDTAIPIFEQNNPNRKLIMWEDMVLNNNTVPKDRVVLQSWNGAQYIPQLVKEGYDVIVSSSDHFYLDCGYGGWITNDPRYLDIPANEDFNNGNGGSWCNPYKTWQRIYDYDFTANLTDAEAQHVLGAEVALWSEQVDSTVITQKIWPRAAALAESTWSGNRDPDTGYLRTTELTQRIFNFREYLVALGYDASPLVPKYCIVNPHSCDFYKNQTILDEFGLQQT